MKARLEAGKIVKYSQIPNKVDNILGGARNLNPEDLGFYDVVVPDYDPITQVIYNLHFDNAYAAPTPENANATKEVFTYDVKDCVLDDIATLKSNKIAELKNLANTKLQLTDWYIVRNAEKNLSVPDDVTSERDNIKSTVAAKETEINSLNTQRAVIEYDINF